MRMFIAAGCLVALAACGGTSDATRMSGEASAYRSAALQVSSSVTSYDTATATMTTPADCTAAVQQHDAQVEPVLHQMGQMAGGMDDAMQSMGQTMGADMECGVTAMQQEMQQHLAAACGSSDMTANRAEAQRHVAAMQGMTDHMQMRADEMSQLIARGMMQGGSMMQGSGMMGGSTNTTTNTTVTGSWTMPNGGTMSWDHMTPGCTFVNGAFQPTSAPAAATPTSGTTSGT